MTHHAHLTPDEAIIFGVNIIQLAGQINQMRAIQHEQAMKLKMNGVKLP